MSIATLIPHDKALHAIGGAVVYAAIRGLSLALGQPAIEAALAALAAVAIVACAKEAFDLHHRAKHTPDLRDAAATIAGGFLALTCGIGPL